jgi:hypothetical protein
MRRIRLHVTYANVMVTILAFIVLGGGAYAAFHLPPNSVRSRNIVNGQVKKHDLKPPEWFHQVGAPGEPRYASGASSAGRPAAFFKDNEGIVH